MKGIVETAERFRNKHNLVKSITYEDLQRIASENEWRLLSYSEAYALLSQHNLYKYANRLKAFTYVFENEIIILYRNDLKYSERIKDVIHEFAHIVLRHTSCDGIIGTSNINRQNRIFEREANIFANALLLSHKFNQYAVSIIISLAAVIILGFIYLNLNINAIPAGSLDAPVTIQGDMTQTVYITPTGKKYHREACVSIKNSEKTSTPKKDAVNDGYEACKLCLPDK